MARARLQETAVCPAVGSVGFGWFEAVAVSLGLEDMETAEVPGGLTLTSGFQKEGLD